MSRWKKYPEMFRQDMKEIMTGRNGLDELSNFIMLIGFIFVIVSIITGMWIFTLLALLFIVLSYLRVFSKKLLRRKIENDFYLKYMGWFVNNTAVLKMAFKMKIKTIRDPEYAYFVCKTCRQIIRVPKGKNKVSIKCPKCGVSFVKRT